MTTENILSMIGSVVALASVVYLAGVKVSRLEVKVDTMWSFIMRRAIAEGLGKGLADFNSPLVIHDEALRMMTPLGPDLRRFYANRRRAPDADLELAIEREFGEEILKRVCIPNNLTMGFCLKIAVAVARAPEPHA